MKLLSVKKSDKPEKKYVANFQDREKSKKIYFGSAGMDDYLTTKDKAQRDRYRARTKSVYNKAPPVSASRLAGDILWGNSTSLNENIKSYKKKYGFECIEKIDSCEEVKQRTKEYLENSDDKFDWFKNTYQKKEGHIEPIKEIFDYFKGSDYYSNLPKKDKRSENYKNFITYIKENVNFRSYYREIIDKNINGKRFYKRNVMVGWAYNPIEKENDLDDEGTDYFSNFFYFFIYLKYIMVYYID